MLSNSNDSQSYTTSSNLPPNRPYEPTSTFTPTAVQLERADALKRFNRWVIYLPLGLLATAAFSFLIYLLIVAIWPPFEDTRRFLSGMADIFLILFMLPVVMIFGLLLVGVFGGAVYWQQSRKEDGEPSLQQKYGRLRLLLWKIDQQYLSKAYHQADKLMPALAQPIIRFNAFMAYINAWLSQLTKQMYRRHDME
jgi:hypothetical protein